MGNTTKKLQFNEVITSLLQDLIEREREVVTRRFALNGSPKMTLEAIGKQYDVTRERVRQIERDAIKKIKEVKASKNPTTLNELTDLVNHFVDAHGGFIGHTHLKSHLLHTQDELEDNALEFIIENLLDAPVSKIEHSEFDNVWHAQEKIAKDTVIDIGCVLQKLIKDNDKPMTFEEIMEKCKTCAIYPTIDKLPAQNHAIIEAALKSRNDLGQNILNQWGLREWTTIKPKRMTDKAYLIMLREGRPVHFEECADLINKAGFDKKKACAATVHNELILDDKYVLVGRGLYALKEWGYQAGTVGDIIETILKEKGPLSKTELSSEVLKQRMVQKTTITLALMNKDRFTKLEDGRYALVK